jgi:hypothetical protein
LHVVLWWIFQVHVFESCIATCYFTVFLNCLDKIRSYSILWITGAYFWTLTDNIMDVNITQFP